MSGQDSKSTMFEGKNTPAYGIDLRISYHDITNKLSFSYDLSHHKPNIHPRGHCCQLKIPN